MSLLTFLSRVSGLIREAAMSRVFGVGPVMDAFAFGFQVPNLFRRLFGEGALSSAFLPEYARAEQTSPGLGRHLAWMVLSRTLALLAALTLVGEIILWSLPPGDADSALGQRLLMVMLPYMPLVCLVALFGAVLQVHHRFGPTAAAPIILNVLVAAAALASGTWIPFAQGDREHIVWVGVFVLVAGVLQVVWCGLSLREIRVTPSPSADDRARAREPFRSVILRTAPMALGLGVLQVNTFIDSLIANYPTLVGPTIFGFAYPLAEGSMSTLSFAQRLYEFPLGVFGISVATAMFPQLSRQASDTAAFKETLIRGLKLAFFIGLPASIGLCVLATPCSAAVFQGDRFSPEDSIRVGSVLMGFSLAIWAYSVNQLLTRAFYARGETMLPVKVSLCMVAINFTLNIVLIWTPLKLTGLAVSTAVCAMIQMIWLWRLLGVRLGGVATKDLMRSWLLTGVASLICGGAAAGGLSLANSVVLPTIGVAGSSWTGAVVTLGVAIPLGAGALGLTALLLRMPELSAVLGRKSAN